MDPRVKPGGDGYWRGVRVWTPGSSPGVTGIGGGVRVGTPGSSPGVTTRGGGGAAPLNPLALAAAGCYTANGGGRVPGPAAM